MVQRGGSNMRPMVHLHWLYDSIPVKEAAKALRETSSGFALCGESKLPNKQLTVFVDDTTCQRCLERAAA
jgi:hypothetical protein